MATRLVGRIITSCCSDTISKTRSYGGEAVNTPSTDPKRSKSSGKRAIHRLVQSLLNRLGIVPAIVSKNGTVRSWLRAIMIGLIVMALYIADILNLPVCQIVQVLEQLGMPSLQEIQLNRRPRKRKESSPRRRVLRGGVCNR